MLWLLLPEKLPACFLTKFLHVSGCHGDLRGDKASVQRCSSLFYSYFLQTLTISQSCPNPQPHWKHACDNYIMIGALFYPLCKFWTHDKYFARIEPLILSYNAQSPHHAALICRRSFYIIFYKKLFNLAHSKRSSNYLTHFKCRVCACVKVLRSRLCWGQLCLHINHAMYMYAPWCNLKVAYWAALLNWFSLEFWKY